MKRARLCLAVALVGLGAALAEAQADLPPVRAAIADLAQRLAVPADQIRLISTEAVTWPDSSLGNPEPGMVYLQVLTDGYRVILQHATTRYEYHTDLGTRVTLVGEVSTGLPETPATGGDSFSVWDGSVDMLGGFGPVNLPPGSSFGPGGTGAAFPEAYGTGSFRPFWEGWGSGVSTGATPGTNAGMQFREANWGALIGNRRFVEVGIAGGSVDVIVQQAGGAAGAGSPGGLGPLLIAAAALGQEQEGHEWLGRRFFAAAPQVDLIALVYDGGSMAGGWLRSSVIYDSFYGEIGLETLGRLDGDGWGTRVSELFLADRIGATDIIAGRQRYLEGPVINSGLGALFGVTHFDGVSVQHRGPACTATAAWLEGYAGWGEGGDQRGWFARLSAPAAGGSAGANVLYDAAAGDWGISVDGSLPAVPGDLDLYAEVGEDPQGRTLYTVGAYLPCLYSAADVDLFVEYADREGFDSAVSATGYWEAGGDWTGLAGARLPQHGDAEFALGAAWRFDGSRGQ